MEIRPILSSLRRNKVGAVLICLQIAITLAIVCNALFVIQQRSQRMARASGLDEANIFTLTNVWIGTPQDIKSRVQEDLAALRSLPGAVDAVATNSFPLRGGGTSSSVSRVPAIESFDPHQPQTTIYVGDEHVGSALGLTLVEGRWFGTEEIIDVKDGDQPKPAVMIVSQALAKRLFPEGGALGKSIWFQKIPTTIVGIVATLQSPWAAMNSSMESFVENSVVMPGLYLASAVTYVVRARPGERDATMQVAEKRLRELNRNRVIFKVEPFAEVRARRYQNDHALNVILATVCVLLLTVTACGIVGLTSYWIAQRRRQIGVRRALGARRVDILRYFHLENLLIAGVGALLGVLLAMGGNLWLVKSFEMARMGLPFVLIGAAIILALGQAAVLWPALRAASIAPAMATRAA